MAQVQSSKRSFFQSCLVWGLVGWAIISVSAGFVLLYLSTSSNNEQTETATATPIVAIAVTVIVPETSTVTATPTESPTSTDTPTPTVTPTFTPTPTPSYDITSTVGVKVYVDPGYDLHAIPVTTVEPKLMPALKIKMITTDYKWIQVCCFLGVTKPELWINVNDVEILRENILTTVGQMVPPSPTPVIPDTHFVIEAGPEFYATDNGFLVIYVKVFHGPDGAQVPQPGYMLKVRFKADGTDEFLDRPATNLGPVSQAQYTLLKNGIHIYNLKYEFDPGNPPDGKKKEDLLGLGQWEIWLTNAEGHELSRRVYFTTNPQNKNRELFMSYGLVR